MESKLEKFEAIFKYVLAHPEFFVPSKEGQAKIDKIIAENRLKTHK